MSEIIGGIAKFAGVWYLAGFIVSAVSMALIFLFGGLIGVATELMMGAAIGSLPFPISFMIGYAVDPLSVVVELIFQFVLFLGLLYLGK